MDIPAEEWVTTYPRSIQTLKEVWDFDQPGEVLLFDEAFEWVKPKTLTKPEHIENYLKHLNQRVQSFVAKDGYIYITVQWRSGSMVYDPIYFRFRYADLDKGKPFFIQSQDKWGNTHIGVNAVGLDTWKVQKDRQRKRIKGGEVKDRVKELMDKMIQGQPLTQAEQQYLQRSKSGRRGGEYYSAWVSKWIDEQKAKYDSNLSKYYRQPKHREGLMIFKPSASELVQEVPLGMLNWEFLRL
jgi:hypothetical protein